MTVPSSGTGYSTADAKGFGEWQEMFHSVGQVAVLNHFLRHVAKDEDQVASDFVSASFVRVEHGCVDLKRKVGVC